MKKKITLEEVLNENSMKRTELPDDVIISKYEKFINTLKKLKHIATNPSHENK